MGTSGEDASERGRAAKARGGELDDRLRRLRDGEPVTADDVNRAEQAAERQRARSAVAHRNAADAHTEAARHHRQTSDVLEAGGHPERAAEHRRRAVLDDEAADVDSASARADEQPRR